MWLEILVACVAVVDVTGIMVNVAGTLEGWGRSVASRITDRRK